MQVLMTGIAVISGMAFSLAIGLAIEEVIFGKVFCLLFARQAARMKTGQR